jgi:hypothetical protein
LFFSRAGNRGGRALQVSEQFDSVNSDARAASTFVFSGEACDLLGATIKDYLERGGVPNELAAVTARLCHEAQTRGLSADQTLAEIRSTLGTILANCPMTTTDRAALVALAIDECVHAFYRRDE